MQDEDSMDEAPVIVVPYDPAWPDRFERERQLLTCVLKPWLTGDIEHVGSTAVPTLAAKPVIDILAPVESLQASLPAIEAVEAIGYCHSDYATNVMHWFCKPSFQVRTHHLHLVPANGSMWVAEIAFRDALRADPRLRNEYADLKYRLAATYRDDREAYTGAKTPFIERVLRERGIDA